MREVRRLYVYGVTTVTLLIAAIGAVNLLGLALDQVLTAISGEGWIQGGPDWERERLSLFLPLVVIATSIWWLHWRMAQRALQGPDAVAERRSTIRAVYLAIVFVAGLQTLFMAGLGSVLDLAIRRLLGGTLFAYERDSLVSNLAIVIVVGAIWAWHIRAYLRDVRAETAETRPALVPQAVLYLAAAIGATMLLIGLGDLIRLAVDAIADADRAGRWWRDPLASGIALAATGGLAWTVHWLLTEHLLGGSGWWGRGERGAALRRVYLVAILLVTGVMTLLFVADGVDGIVRLALDARERPDETRLTAIAGPLLSALPVAGFWLLHRRRLLAEPAVPGNAIAPATAERLLGYPMALLGLVVASTGAARLLGEIVAAVAGEGGWREDAGWPLGLLLGGGALWAVSWLATRARFARDPEAEQASTARRAYLFIALGGAVVALVVGLAMTIYQVMQEVLGVAEAGDLAEEIALPLGITVVTLAVAVTHGLLLRRDLPVRGLLEREEEGATRLELVLTGPADADLAEAVRAMRRSLPEGYAIEARAVGPSAPAPPESPDQPPDTGNRVIPAHP
jgi:hypothetical protein